MLNIVEDVYLPKKQTEDLKNSNAYKLAKANNIDTDILEGKEVDPNSGEIKFEPVSEADQRIYLKDVTDFITKDVPRDSLIGITKGLTNAGVILNNVTNLMGINPDSSYEFIQDKLMSQKERLSDLEQDSTLVNKLISVLPQGGMYTVPIYKKFKAAGVPTSYAFPISAAIGETLAFDKTETFLVDSKMMRTVKESMNIPPDSSAEEVYDRLVQAGEYAVAGTILEKIFSGVMTARKLKADQGQQGSIAVGGGASSGAAVQEMTSDSENVTESEEKKTPIIDDQSMVPGTVNEYGYELTAAAVPAFKSILKEVVRKQPNKASGQQLFNTIKNTPGVKSSELKWTGADDFMKENPKASKDELLEYLRTNEFKVVETDFGANKYSGMFEELEDLSFDLDSDDVISVMNKYNFPGDRYDVERFIEIKRDKNFLEDALQDFRGEVPTDGFFIKIGADPDFQTDLSVPITKFDDALLNELRLIRDNTPAADLPNVYDDFLDTNNLYYSPSNKTLSYDSGLDGQKVSYLNGRNIEAVQTELSLRDLDNELRELGPEFQVPQFERQTLQGGDDYQVKAFSFKDDNIPATKTKEINIPGREGDPIKTTEPAGFSYRGGHLGVPGEFAHVRYKERNIEGKKTVFIEEMQSDLGQALASGGKKPGEKIDFPFKNTWYELVFKRMIRDAADKGFDQIAIPSGVVAARRYMMDRTIRSITARKGMAPEDDDIVITLANRFGEENTQQLNREEFKKLIKNDKINKDIDNFYDGVMSASRGETYYSVNQSNNVFLTLNLKEKLEIIDPDNVGKVELYDKAFPSFLKKYGKKWGSTVRVIDSSEEKMLRPYQLELDMKFGGKKDPSSNILQAESYIEEGQDIRPIQNLLDKRDFKIYVFEISDEMKKSVQEEGQSLFEVLAPIAGTGVAADAVLDNKRNNIISN